MKMSRKSLRAGKMVRKITRITRPQSTSRGFPIVQEGAGEREDCRAK